MRGQGPGSEHERREAGGAPPTPPPSFGRQPPGEQGGRPAFPDDPSGHRWLTVEGEQAHEDTWQPAGAPADTWLSVEAPASDVRDTTGNSADGRASASHGRDDNGDPMDPHDGTPRPASGEQPVPAFPGAQPWEVQAADGAAYDWFAEGDEPPARVPSAPQQRWEPPQAFTAAAAGMQVWPAPVTDSPAMPPWPAATGELEPDDEPYGPTAPATITHESAPVPPSFGRDSYSGENRTAGPPSGEQHAHPYQRASQSGEQPAAAQAYHHGPQSGEQPAHPYQHAPQSGEQAAGYQRAPQSGEQPAPYQRAPQSGEQPAAQHRAPHSGEHPAPHQHGPQSGEQAAAAHPYQRDLRGGEQPVAAPESDPSDAFAGWPAGPGPAGWGPEAVPTGPSHYFDPSLTTPRPVPLSAPTPADQDAPPPSNRSPYGNDAEVYPAEEPRPPYAVEPTRPSYDEPGTDGRQDQDADTRPAQVPPFARKSVTGGTMPTLGRKGPPAPLFDPKQSPAAQMGPTAPPPGVQAGRPGPDAAQPGNSGPHPAHPGTTGPQAAQAGSTGPHAAQPGTTGPQAAPPGGTGPHAAQAGTTGPQAVHGAHPPQAGHSGPHAVPSGSTLPPATGATPPPHAPAGTTPAGRHAHPTPSPGGQAGATTPHAAQAGGPGPHAAQAGGTGPQAATAGTPNAAHAGAAPTGTQPTQPGTHPGSTGPHAASPGTAAPGAPTAPPPGGQAGAPTPHAAQAGTTAPHTAQAGGAAPHAAQAGAGPHAQTGPSGPQAATSGAAGATPTGSAASAAQHLQPSGAQQAHAGGPQQAQAGGAQSGAPGQSGAQAHTPAPSGAQPGTPPTGTTDSGGPATGSSPEGTAAGDPAHADRRAAAPGDVPVWPPAPKHEGTAPENAEHQNAEQDERRLPFASQAWGRGSEEDTEGGDVPPVIGNKPTEEPPASGSVIQGVPVPPPSAFPTPRGTQGPGVAVPPQVPGRDAAVPAQGAGRPVIPPQGGAGGNAQPVPVQGAGHNAPPTIPAQGGDRRPAVSQEGPRAAIVRSGPVAPLAGRMPGQGEPPRPGELAPLRDGDGRPPLTGVQVQEPAKSKRALFATLGVLVLAGVATGGFFAVQAANHSTAPIAGAPTSIPSSEPSVVPSPDSAEPAGTSRLNSEITDPEKLSIKEAFPDKKVSAAGTTFTRVKTQLADNCADAASGPFAEALKAQKCSRVLRATYVDRKRRYAVTTGIAVMPSKDAAIQADQAKDLDRNQWFRGLPGPDGSGGDRVHIAGGYAAGLVWGRYIVFSYATHADGRTPDEKEKNLVKVSSEFRDETAKVLERRINDN